MVSDADYEQVLAALIEKVCGLLDAESGGFMLYDPAAGELQLQRPALGLDDDDDRIDVYRVPLSAGGNAVTVFLTGQPYFTNDAPNDPRCIQRYIELFDVERFMTVRLQVQDRPIGVFHAMNRRDADFTVDDQDLLQLVAPHLAVMIQSAAMLRSLRKHERELERLIQMHNSLIDMAIRGHDLTDLARRLAELLQFDVVVCEADGQPMVATDARRRLPAQVPALLRHAMESPVTQHRTQRLGLDQGGEAVVTRRRRARAVGHPSCRPGPSPQQASRSPPMAAAGCSSGRLRRRAAARSPCTGRRTEVPTGRASSTWAMRL